MYAISIVPKKALTLLIIQDRGTEAGKQGYCIATRVGSDRGEPEMAQLPLLLRRTQNYLGCVGILRDE